MLSEKYRLCVYTVLIERGKNVDFECVYTKYYLEHNPGVAGKTLCIINLVNFNK